MAIAIKSYTTGTNNGSTATVSVTTGESPSATVTGDLVIVIHGNDFYTAATMPVPSATGSPTMNAISGGAADAGTNHFHIKSYWYVANTNGAQTISATHTGTHDEEKTMTAIVLSGADTTTAIDNANSGFSTGSGSTVPSPSASPTSSDAFFITEILAGINGATWTTPAPLTENGEINVTVSISGVVASEQLSASGSTGSFTFTPSITSNEYAAVTITVLTAGGGGGGGSLPEQTYVLPSRAAMQSTTY